ncbi:MAG: sugar ABC transporter ATP-binding protein [Bradyrhizobium sp.]|uniref:sugar ABC transporter ATP-binding protein n=1 Tax=Bradyrhizobium sp. TaxID=376 RepID=UPI001E0C56FF|nr:sugar ABC transporter ATP-binding protein [Bradyrhizobium sp.]MBV9566147.1 sugar ABC transporter ATP-binding protein [Bradyrhizobium sp.]
MSEDAAPFLELNGISKTYPGVVALDGVSLSVCRGEIVGLIGENGAGKSTLMKVLGGVVEPTAGTIRVDGRDRAAFSVNDAITSGIAFVHQELNLFDNLDVGANVLIGREPLYGGPLRLIDRKAIKRKVQPLLDRLGADFTPDTPVAELSLAQQQLLEIAKALSLDARLVIMDEPTSSLTLTETERLLTVLHELRRDGVSIIFISHRLNEVKACADRVVVLRDGRVVGALDGERIKPEAMIRLMIGRDLKSLYIPPKTAPGAPVLEIEDFRTSAFPDHPVSLTLRRGEILGLAGLIGAGRTELACAAFGIDRPLSGTLRIDGKAAAIAEPRDAIARGLYLVPEDRKRAGLHLEFSLTENISLPDLKSYATGSLISPIAEAGNAEAQRQRLNIKAYDVATEAGTLSGGNQQKIVLAKWLSMKPRVIIFDEPTRGIDVGAKSEIYALMRALADAGVAVLMISSDMEEVIGVSDRMAVMHEGTISGFLERDRFSEHNVLQLAVGKTLN